MLAGMQWSRHSYTIVKSVNQSEFLEAVYKALQMFIPLM